MIARWKASRVSGNAAAEKVRRYGAMWQSLYGAAWLAMLNLQTEAIWIGCLAIAGFAAMTALKEINGLTGKPLTWRG